LRAISVVAQGNIVKALRLIPCLTLLALAACQQAGAEDGRAIDINAAALRAQGDIDHYAADRDAARHLTQRLAARTL
jgi:hypothetical protein